MAFTSSALVELEPKNKSRAHKANRAPTEKAKIESVAKHDLSSILEFGKNQAAQGKKFALTPKLLHAIWAPRFTDDEIFQLIIPQRTLARRKVQKSELSQDETDRAIRLAFVVLESDRVFGNVEKSSRWLRKPNRLLNSQTPLSLLKTDVGSSIIKNMLGQISHGMFA
jgi:putative toxin-antitoxin system antitoxin component (TIGR02293 family)